ncbi:hypothetical protein [Fusicatenibacter sp.]
MVLVAAVALGSSTYAWFVTNTKVTAGTAQVSATTANTLLIQNADSQWATSYDFTETNTNLVPVSTVGKKAQMLLNSMFRITGQKIHQMLSQ